jgi:hypothetical protein
MQIPEKNVALGYYRDNAADWLVFTIFVWFIAILTYPLFICGCCFHWVAMPIGFLPIVWAVYTFFMYYSWYERMVCYLNIALSFFWFYVLWDSNLKHGLHKIILTMWL